MTAEKSEPSAAMARAHRDLICSSEDIAVRRMSNNRADYDTGKLVDLSTGITVSPKKSFDGSGVDDPVTAIYIGVGYSALVARPSSQQGRREIGALGTGFWQGEIIRIDRDNYESEDHATCAGWRAGGGIGDWADWRGHREIAKPSGGEKSSARH